MNESKSPKTKLPRFSQLSSAKRSASRTSSNVPIQQRPRRNLDNLDLEADFAMWKQAQKIRPIDKQLRRLERTLDKVARKSAHSGNEAPSHIGKPLHQRFSQCRSDLERLALPRLALPDAPTTTTPNTLMSLDGEQIDRGAIALLEARFGSREVDLAEWNAVLKFIECYTVWLLPFRGLIEDARGGLFPPGTIVLETRTIQHPAREVAEAALRISTIASILPSRPIVSVAKPRLWVYFETLLIIEQWYQDNRVPDPTAKPYTR